MEKLFFVAERSRQGRLDLGITMCPRCVRDFYRYSPRQQLAEHGYS